MATRRIREFLDGSAVRYVTISHSPAYTAQETAQSTHIPGRKMAKTVVVWINEKLALAVVPATKDVDLAMLRRRTGAFEVRLAEEADIANHFKGCQLGAIPPFGNLFGIETFIDHDLARREEIAFAAGTHTDAIVMKTEDFERLVRPTPARIGMEPMKFPVMSF